MLNLNFACFT